MAMTPKISPYLHLPLQSGSDRILRRMARDYDTAAYLSLVDRLRTAIPDLALSTDIIVGFPQEDESDFAATLTSQEGSGLGLHLALSAAQAHGGSIEVRANPDGGAAFVMSLPMENK